MFFLSESMFFFEAMWILFGLSLSVFALPVDKFKNTSIFLAIICIGVFFFLGESCQWGQMDFLVTIPLNIPLLELNIGQFRVDPTAYLFASLILVIGAGVFLLCRTYFQETPCRFLGLILIFMLSMIGVVFSDGFIAFFIFWELTSLISYFLICFHYHRSEVRFSAWQAFFVTGGGGLFLLGGILLLSQQIGVNSFSGLIRANIIPTTLVQVALVMMLIGALTKSAQWPFSFWLPSAMCAPTPASAYLHSATMVKLGILLLVRIYPVFHGYTIWSIILAVSGGLTMSIGAFLSLKSFDMKKVLAYSTVSMLGLMCFSLAFPIPEICQKVLVLIAVHAFSKAGLFFVCACVDRTYKTRDIRDMSQIGASGKILAIFSLILFISKVGLFPMKSFAVKALFYEGFYQLNKGAFILFAITNICGFIAIFRAFVLPFYAKLKEEPQKKDLRTIVKWPAYFALFVFIVLSFPSGFQWVYQNLLALIHKGGHHIEVQILEYSIYGIAGIACIGLVMLRNMREKKNIWKKIDRIIRQDIHIKGFSQKKSFEVVVQWIKKQARLITNKTHSQKIHIYLVGILGVGFLGLILNLMSKGGLLWVGQKTRWYESMVIVFSSLFLLMILRVSNRLKAIFCLAMVQGGVALMYIFFGAPDLLLTHFIVDGLTVMFLMILLKRIPETTSQPTKSSLVINSIIATLAGGGIFCLLNELQKLPLLKNLMTYIYKNSLLSAYGKNLVNVIIVDFRALDTLFETLVVLTVAIGVDYLFRKNKNET